MSNFCHKYVCLFVCWSLTSLCHSNGHIETMPAREINPFTAPTRIRSQFLRTLWSTSNHSEWTRQRIRPLSHRGWLCHKYDMATYEVTTTNRKRALSASLNLKIRVWFSVLQIAFIITSTRGISKCQGYGRSVEMDSITGDNEAYYNNQYTKIYNTSRTVDKEYIQFMWVS